MYSVFNECLIRTLSPGPRIVTSGPVGAGTSWIGSWVARLASLFGGFGRVESEAHPSVAESVSSGESTRVAFTHARMVGLTFDSTFMVLPPVS